MKFIKFIIFSILILSLEIESKSLNSLLRSKTKDDELPDKFCWKKSRGRGVGSIGKLACKDTEQWDAGLCYKPCPSGMKGVGPVCWEFCKSGESDTGAFCGHWWPPYWRAKKTQGRGVGGITSKCTQGADYDAGLCYEQCGPGMKGVGPVCWGTCTGDTPTDCGAACANSSKNCASEIFKMVGGVFEAITSIAGLVFTGGASAVAKAGVQGVIKGTVTGMLKTLSKNSVKTILKNAGKTVLKNGMKDIEKAIDTGNFDARELTNLDPTGIASMINNFVKSVC